LHRFVVIHNLICAHPVPIEKACVWSFTWSEYLSLFGIRLEYSTEVVNGECVGGTSKKAGSGKEGRGLGDSSASREMALFGRKGTYIPLLAIGPPTTINWFGPPIYFSN